MQLKDKIDSSKRGFKLFLENSDRKKLTFGVLLILAVLIVISSFFIYIRNTEIVPAEGGSYTEGILGAPRFLNPIYSQKSEVDKDLTEILFAGIMTYDEDNELQPELADSVETDDYRTFEVSLREDIYWSDGEKITTDDVIFTIEKIQNRSIQSPLRISWEGVRVERESERDMEIILENPSPLFIEKLTVKPIPKHIWEDVDADDFQFSDYNLDPIVSGPYKVESVEEEDRVESISLTRNPHYFSDSYIDELNFLFFRSEEALISNKSDLDGFALPSIKNEVNTSFKSYSYRLPRYFGLFFNLNDYNKNERLALRKALDKQSIVDSLTNVDRISSPIIPEFYGFSEPGTKYENDTEKALELFEDEGYNLEDGRLETITQEESEFEFTERLTEDDQGEEVRRLQECLIDLTDEYDIFPNGEVTGYFDESTTEAVNRFQETFREDILDPHGFNDPTGMVAGSTQNKLNEFCGGTIPEEREQFTVEITTINHPLLSRVIEKLEDQWSQLGIEVKAREVDHQTIQSEIIEEKNFDSFLFGISMESIPDPFRWWHSSQTESPGLNFTGFENEEADDYLSTAVTSTDEEERIAALESFQEKVLEEKPAIFLYSPHYIYKVSGEVNGLTEGKLINSSQRFKNINNWYINTQRKWINN